MPGHLLEPCNYYVRGLAIAHFDGVSADSCRRGSLGLTFSSNEATLQSCGSAVAVGSREGHAVSPSGGLEMNGPGAVFEAGSTSARVMRA